MTDSIVSKFPVTAADLPAEFADNVYSGQIVQSKSIADTELGTGIQIALHKNSAEPEISPGTLFRGRGCSSDGS